MATRHARFAGHRPHARLSIRCASDRRPDGLPRIEPQPEEREDDSFQPELDEQAMPPDRVPRSEPKKLRPGLY